MPSLRAQLFGLWALLAASAAITGYLILQFYQQTAARQVSEAEEVVARACRSIADRYQFYTAGWRPSSSTPAADDLRRQLTSVVQTALRSIPGVEGGIWQNGPASLAYAYPTYEGTGPKTDIPVAELATIGQVNADALRNDAPTGRRVSGRAQTLLVHACPLPGPLSGLTGWTMTRVYTWAGPAYNRLLLGLGVLAFTVVVSAMWLMATIIGWSRRLSVIREKLGGDYAVNLPRLEATGEKELDRLVVALNDAGERLGEAHKRVAEAERLAAIGRLSAGLAHEVRNPIMAMRLKAENALASDDTSRRSTALQGILEQVGRLDALLSDLLAMTQRRQLHVQAVNIKSFLHNQVEAHQELATSKGIRIVVSEPEQPCQAYFDPVQLGRALDNLVLNAVQALPAGGHVTLSARRVNTTLRLTVEDDGPGVSADIRDHLFDPFVTGRAEGTGLGLAIVREIARAHGGDVRLASSDKGSVFEIEVPWRMS